MPRSIVHEGIVGLPTQTTGLGFRVAPCVIRRLGSGQEPGEFIARLFGPKKLDWSLCALLVETPILAVTSRRRTPLSGVAPGPARAALYAPNEPAALARVASQNRANGRGRAGVPVRDRASLEHR